MSFPWSDLALDAPTVYYDPDAKVAIAPVWTDGGSAGVSVTGEGSARFPSSTSIELIIRVCLVKRIVPSTSRWPPMDDCCPPPELPATRSTLATTSGVDVSKLRVKRNDPTGTNVIQAHASLDSAIFGDASASFDVQ